jgi:hypothetical protein
MSTIRRETIAVVTLVDVEYDGSREGAREAVIESACRSMFCVGDGGSQQYGKFGYKSKHSRLDVSGD